MPLNLTTEEKENIDKAKQIQKKIDLLYQDIDTLIYPIVQKHNNASIGVLNALVDILPSGFHRSELRVLISTLSKK